MSASPVIQTGHFFVRPICLSVAYLPIAPGGKTTQTQNQEEEGRSILQKALQHPITLFIPDQREDANRKKGSSHVQEPAWPKTVRWGGKLTPDTDQKERRGSAPTASNVDVQTTNLRQFTVTV